MNIRFISIILLSLASGMTSCTPDDVPMTDNEQIEVTATNTSDPSPEHEGDDEELEEDN